MSEFIYESQEPLKYSCVELFVDDVIERLDSNAALANNGASIYCNYELVQSILGVLLDKYNLEVAFAKLDAFEEDLYELIIDNDFIIFVNPIERNNKSYSIEDGNAYVYAYNDLPVRFVNELDNLNIGYILFDIEDFFVMPDDNDEDYYYQDDDCYIEKEEPRTKSSIKNIYHDDNLYIYDIGIDNLKVALDLSSERPFRFIVDDTGVVE